MEKNAQGAFQVQKTREAKKRSSNAPSADKVKADINKKEKQREKTSYNRKIDGMNRAGTPSGKVAAARLRGMKKVDAMEEVDSPFDKGKIDQKQNTRKNERNFRIAKAGDTGVENGERIATKRGIATLPSFANKKPKVSTATEELSIDQQMKISQDYNRLTPEEKKAANKRVMGNTPKVPPKPDTRTDTQKMADAYASPRKGPGGATRTD